MSSFTEAAELVAACVITAILVAVALVIKGRWFILATVAVVLGYDLARRAS